MSCPPLSALLGMGLVLCLMFASALCQAHTSDTDFLAKLSSEEREFLRVHPVLRVANEPDWPPFDFTVRGQPRGYAVDLMNLLADHLGVELQFVTASSWGKLIDMARKRELDILPAASRTRERGDYLNFTSPFIQMQPVIVAHKDDNSYHSMADLAGRTLALTHAFSFIETVKRDYPDIHIVEVANPVDGLKKVALRQTDFYMDHLPVANYLIESHFLPNLQIAGEVTLADSSILSLHIATRNDWPLLGGILEQALISLGESELMPLRRRWAGTQPPEGKPPRRIALSHEQRTYLSNNSPLRLCVDPDWPPYEWLDESGTHVGMAADYFQLFSDRLGASFRLVPTKSWNESITLMKEGGCDLLSLLNETPDRRGFLDFSPPYLTSPVVLVINEQSPTTRSLSDMHGRVLGLVPGYVHNETVRRDYPRIRYEDIESIDAGLLALSKGEIDGLVDSLYVVSTRIRELGLGNLLIAAHTEYLHELRVGIRKGEPILKGVVDEVVDSLSLSDHESIRRRWHKVENHHGGVSQRIRLTVQERDYLRSKQSIRMCVDPDWAPFEWIDEQGRHQGIAADTLRLMAERIGTPIELVPTTTWRESMERAKRRECDIFSAAMATPERRRYMDFITPYLELPPVVVTRDQPLTIHNLAQIADRPVGAVAGYVIHHLIKERHPDIQLVDVESVYDGLRRVASGQLHAFVDTLGAVSHNIRAHGMDSVKISGHLGFDWQLGVATRNDEPLLRSIFDKATRSVTPAEHGDIFSRWVNIRYEKGMDYTLAIQIIAGAGILLIFLLVWNRKLANLNEQIRAHAELIDKHVLMSTIDRHGFINNVSSAFCRSTGYCKEELLGLNQSLLRMGSIPDSEYKKLWQTIKSGNTWNGELPIKRKNDSSFWIAATISPIVESNTIIGYTATGHDISDKKRVEKLSITDELTQLYNRRRFNDVFLLTREKIRGERGIFGLLLVDIDHFKRFNDTYGHFEGDRVLISLGEALIDCLRRSDDMAFRLGGEEFAAIVTADTVDGIFHTAERIRTAVAQLTITHTGNSPYGIITVSVGVMSVSPDDHTDKEAIYRSADAALYTAKRKGRNRVCAADMNDATRLPDLG